MLPLNIETYSENILGIGDFIIHNVSNHTNHDFERVISVSVTNNDTNADLKIICGNKTIGIFNGNEYPQLFLNIECETNNVIVQNSGQGDAFVSINMLHNEPVYSLSTSTATTSPFTSLSTINGFTYGEVMIILVLFLMLVIMFFGGLWNRVTGIKNKMSHANKYMGNNSEEGKIIYID